jgi:hypothetical protein
MSKNDNGKMDFSKMLASLVAVFKAVPEDKLADLQDSIDHAGAARIPDMWNEARGEHKAPGRAEIVTGPAERMSSSGAEKMIREYSEPTPQGGLAEVYNTFHNILADFGKSMKADFDRRFAPLADVVTDLAKNQAALDALLKAAQEEVAQKAAPAETEDTFFGKAQTKLAAARKAFRKAEMEEDEEEREERKARLTKISDMLKSALKLISKADDEGEDKDEDEVEKAVAAVKALQSKVAAALAVITKAEESEAEEKKEEEAEKAQKPDAATAKAEDAQEEEEEKDDTAKSIAALTQQLSQVQEALKGNAVLHETVTSLLEKVSGLSKGSLATPPNLVVVKGGNDPHSALTAAIDNGELSGSDVLAAQQLLVRSRHAANGAYPQEKLNADIAAAPPSVRRYFVA